MTDADGKLAHMVSAGNYMQGTEDTSKHQGTVHSAVRQHYMYFTLYTFIIQGFTILFVSRNLKKRCSL